ncbi:hypothetical protein EBO15_09655 [Actinomadura harenae]|uniref:CU044_5270 family protein n=2 Tax=Actinomadura harenae TaxID=2483351 RepID=A0A3M2ME02_9ACTN|nr:hypothetical protein EBO15_09655 [Actinomadura harenae]
MTRLERFRAEVPRPGLSDLQAEERRLMGAMVDPAFARPASAAVRPRRARRLKFGLAAGLAAAAVTAGVVAVSPGPGRKPLGSPVIHTMPVAAVQILQRAADHVDKAPELHPRPGQFLVFDSRTMNPVDTISNGRAAHYLSRAKRTIWLPVEGDATHGVLWTQGLVPLPYPGWPIPPEAREEAGRSSLGKAADVDHRAEWLRNDFAYLSRLPADPAKMYEHLYTHLGNGSQADAQAWSNVGGMLTEAYMPAPQRAALFRAAAAIRGVTTVGKAVDAAGRTGIAVALVVPGSGIRDEYIFTPKTYQYLGQRSVVTDAAQAGAPVGSVLTSTAQLTVRVAERAPAINGH